MSEIKAAAEARVTGSSRGTLILLCAAQFMLIVDVVVVNVALPTIRADLAVPDGRLHLVAVGYTLTFGSLLIVFGRIGDLFGRRRLFLIGLGAFTLASLATGLAQAEWQILTARAAQGVGAAMVSPTALALLTTAFAEGDRRNRALGHWGAVGSGGAIAGTSGVPDRDQGLASGVLNSAQELGTAVCVTVLGAIATAATLGTDVAALTTGYRVGLLTAGAVTVLSLILVIGIPRPAANAGPASG